MLEQSGDPEPVCPYTHIYVLTYTEVVYSTWQRIAEFLLGVIAISLNPMAGIYP